MKRSFASLAFVAALGAAISMSPITASAAADAGEYDFGEFSVPPDGKQFVEVNLTHDLIAIASRLVARQEPDVAAVLKGLQRVRVHVIGLGDDNRAEMTRRIMQVRDELTQRGWQRVVTVRQEGQDVGVYMKTQGEETIEGVVVTVLGEDNQAVFVNVVGNIKPEQIAMIGERFNIEPLKEIDARPATGG